MEAGRTGPSEDHGHSCRDSFGRLWEIIAGKDGSPRCGTSLAGLLTDSRSQLAGRVKGWICWCDRTKKRLSEAIIAVEFVHYDLLKTFRQPA